MDELLKITKYAKEAISGKGDPLTEPDAERKFGVDYSDGVSSGTLLPYSANSVGVIDGHLGVKIPAVPNAPVPQFGADGENFAKRVFIHPLSKKKTIAEGTGIEMLAEIGSDQHGQIIHFSKGMAFVNAVLAPFTRQITNSTGLVTNGNRMLLVCRNWLMLSWLGGPVAKLSTVLRIPGMGGDRTHAPAPRGTIGVGPSRPPTTGD